MVDSDVLKDALLRSELQPVNLQVLDISGGCGASFEVHITSAKFVGMRLLDRHKLVNAALSPYMKDIHALSIKKCWTPEQLAAASSASI